MKWYFTSYHKLFFSKAWRKTITSSVIQPGFIPVVKGKADDSYLAISMAKSNNFWPRFCFAGHLNYVILLGFPSIPFHVLQGGDRKQKGEWTSPSESEINWSRQWFLSLIVEENLLLPLIILSLLFHQLLKDWNIHRFSL